jgi:hypothetical protein
MRPHPTRKPNEISARDIIVHFSPAVRAKFAGLAASVKGSEHFAWEVLDLVREIAEGKEFTVADAMGHLGVIIDEAKDYSHRTGDYESLQILVDGLIADNWKSDEPGFILVRAHQKLRTR